MARSTVMTHHPWNECIRCIDELRKIIASVLHGSMPSLQTSIFPMSHNVIVDPVYLPTSGDSSQPKKKSLK